MSQRGYRFAPAALDDLTEHGNYLLKNISEAAMADFFRSLYPGYEIVAALGVAEGYALRLYPALSAAGQRDSFTAMLSEATLDMLQSARDHDGQGIVGLRYVTLGDGGLLVYGTTVSIRRVDQTAISVSGPSIRQ